MLLDHQVFLSLSTKLRYHQHAENIMYTSAHNYCEFPIQCFMMHEITKLLNEVYFFGQCPQRSSIMATYCMYT